MATTIPTTQAASVFIEFSDYIGLLIIHPNLVYPLLKIGAKKGQYGKNIPWGDVPARPFLPTEEAGLPGDMEREIVNIINAHLADVLK